MSLDQGELIDGLHNAPAVLAGEAALIAVNVDRTTSGVAYVYSLMKIKQDPHGIQYNLTLHLVGDHVQQIQGFFFEGETTGLRDAVVYEMATRNDALTARTEADPSGGWARDPYNGSVTGFSMNMSELPEFDTDFPTHPLSMARELLRAVRAS